MFCLSVEAIQTNLMLKLYAHMQSQTQWLFNKCRYFEVDGEK